MRAGSLVGRGAERKGICVSLSLDFFSRVWAPKAENALLLLLSLWSPGSPAGSSVDACTLNIQTHRQRTVGVRFLQWLLAVCNVYWIFKTVFDLFLQHWRQSYGLEKRNLLLQPFLTFIPKLHFSPAALTLPVAAGGWGPVPGTPARSCPACELRAQWFPVILRKKTNLSSSVCTCNKQHHVRRCSVRCPVKVKTNEWGKSQTEWNWKNAMDEISKELFLRNNSNRKPLPFHFLRF